MAVTKLEQILSKEGKAWTREEREIVVYFFFYNNNGVPNKKYAQWLVNNGMPETDAEVRLTKLMVRLLEKPCSYDPNNPNNRGSEPTEKFAAYLQNRVYFNWRDWRRDQPARGIVSTDQPVNSDSDLLIGDNLKSSYLNPEQQSIWDEIKRKDKDLKHQQNEQRERDWQIASKCLEHLPPAQQEAIRLRDFEGMGYKQMLIMPDAPKFGALRRRVNAGRAKMINCLSKHGIDYLELINEDDETE